MFCAVTPRVNERSSHSRPEVVSMVVEWPAAGWGVGAGGLMVGGECAAEFLGGEGGGGERVSAGGTVGIWYKVKAAF